MPKPKQVISSLLAGFKTFIGSVALVGVGAQEAVYPDVADIISPDASTETITAGLLMLVLRYFTNTPMFKKTVSL